MLADEVERAPKRPGDPKVLGLLVKRYQHDVDLPWDQGGLVQRQQIGNLERLQCQPNLWPHLWVRQECRETLGTFSKVASGQVFFGKVAQGSQIVRMSLQPLLVQAKGLWKLKQPVVIEGAGSLVGLFIILVHAQDIDIAYHGIGPVLEDDQDFS